MKAIWMRNGGVVRRAGLLVTCLLGIAAIASSEGYDNPAWKEPVQPPTALWGRMVPATPLAEWFKTHAWLADRSTWASYVPGNSRPTHAQLGAFGVGNGRVFGMIGLALPLNTIHGMCGPHYSGGLFCDLSVGVEVASQSVDFDEEWLWKPRRAAAAITKSRCDEVEMYTVDVAPPGVDAIVRVVIVRNPTDQPLADVCIVARLRGEVSSQAGRLVQARGGRCLVVAAAGEATARDGRLRVPLGEVPAHAERVVTLSCAFFDGDPRPVAPIDVDRLLEATRAHWADFFAKGVQLGLPDPKVQDFVEDMTVTCEVQIAENGCASPMSRYTCTWMRDQEGPLRLFLRTARPEPVRRMLDAYYRTAILEGGIFNSMPADRDVASAGAPPDWMKAEFMPGSNRFPTEAPSYIPIELYDTWLATGDEALLREQYDFAKAAVLRQDVSKEGLLRFNGDEPFRWVMMMATGLYEPEFRGWSANSGFLYVAAADRMAKVAALLGKADDAERTFNAIGQFAQCTGEIAEGHTAAKRGVMALQYSAEQKSGDTTARYRPWEGGIVADAVLQYLIGEEWDAAAGRVAVTPHMPNGWGTLEARGLRCGTRTYDVEVRDFRGRRLERVTNRSAEPLDVDLGASVPGARIGEGRVDGKAVRPEVDFEFGRSSFRVQKTLGAGAWIDLDFDCPSK